LEKPEALFVTAIEGRVNGELSFQIWVYLAIKASVRRQIFYVICG
jgi:hypothetical protein